MSPQTKKTLFISDLHLDLTRPSITQLFIKFLAEVDESIDGIFILGDLFEAWIGDDDDSAFHRSIIDALKTVTKTVPVYFMPGNRDFLIGKKFLKATGCQLLGDEEKITLYGTPVLLMHGDTLCTRDVAYLKWRKKARNRILHTLFFLSLPLRWRRKMAEKMRQASAQHTRGAAKEIMDVTQTEVERVMSKHQVQTLIHGHTHRPNIHHLTINHSPAQRMVLDTWHDHGSVLVWDHTGKTSTVILS